MKRLDFTRADLLDSNPGGPSRAERKLEGFDRLPVGWHYGAGGPIPRRNVNLAKEILKTMIGLGLTTNDAFPGTAGEIMLTAYHRDHYVEILIKPDLSIDLEYEMGNKPVKDYLGKSQVETSAALREVTGLIWNMSDLFTQNTTIAGKKSSKASPSRRWATAEPQLSSSTAWRAQA